MKILISTSTFAEFDRRPLELLKKNGFLFSMNSHKKKLSREQALELYKDIDGVVAGTETVDKELLDASKKLKVISRCGAGMDGLDLEYAKTKGIKVFNTADAPTDAVAELALGLILSLLRQIPLLDRQMRQGRWTKSMGALLNEKIVGIIGLGRIGRRLAYLANGLGAKAVYYDPLVKNSGLSFCAFLPFQDLLKEADIVSLHIPYSKENKHLIGKNELALMKNTAFLINTSRGGIVDEDALYQALKNNKLAGAALDVFEDEPYGGKLKELDNIILTPHIGSYAKEARIKMEIESVENLLKGFNLSL